MPIVHFVNNKSQSAGGMKTVLGYVSQEKKTVREDRRYITGINCDPAQAYDEMMLTKRLYKKSGGRLYYHLVQSFPKGYEISPELAHKIACEFAEKALGKYECVVATHIDREHIHSHIVFNSVSFEDGKKYHSDLNSVKGLMIHSDEICLKYGVSVLDDPSDKFRQKKATAMTDREFRSADKGESWKMQLMFAITECMKQAKSRKQFCYLMHSNYGYGVRWEDNRKHITYTTPNGYRCRDKRLHENKFLKEAMENEFRIRHEIIDGKEQTTASTGGETNHNDGNHRAELVGGGRGTYERGRVAGRNNQDHEQGDDCRADENVPQQSVDSVGTEHSRGQRLAGTDSSRQLSGNERTEVTGWESERRILLSAERARRMAAESQQAAHQGNHNIAVDAADIVGGVANLASIINNAPTDPEELERYIDSVRAAQNAGFLIGAAIGVIELLSERLEEMKAEPNKDIHIDYH